MKLGVEVKNGQQSSNPELFFDSTPLTPPTTLPHTRDQNLGVIPRVEDYQGLGQTLEDY